MTDRVQIGDHRWIGPGEPTFVIAEVGSNHNQELDQAKRLIQTTAEAGADAVKFQLFSADILYPGGGEIHAAFRAVELSRDWVPELADYSRERGLLFLASAFDEGAVDCLEAVGSPAHKVASSETTNLPLLKYMASKQKPILMSTGMCDLADIFEAVEVVHSEKNTDIALFQCTTLYPTEPRQLPPAGDGYPPQRLPGARGLLGPHPGHRGARGCGGPRGLHDREDPDPGAGPAWA